MPPTLDVRGLGAKCAHSRKPSRVSPESWPAPGALLPGTESVASAAADRPQARTRGHADTHGRLGRIPAAQPCWSKRAAERGPARPLRPGPGPITADAANWLADSDKVTACATRVTLLPDVRPAGRATRPQARRQAGAAGPRAVRRPPGGRPAGGPRTGRPQSGRTATSRSSCRATAASGRAPRRAAGPGRRHRSRHGRPRRWATRLAEARSGASRRPGQPPPLYPPGQFAAWNRPDGQVAVADPDSAWPAAPGSDWSQDRPWPAEDALAVSEPSADVTATGTWRTYSDDPDDGTWGPPRGGAGLRCPSRLRRQRASWPGTGWTRRAVAAGGRQATGPGRAGGGAPTVVPPNGSSAVATAASAGPTPAYGRDGSAGDRAFGPKRLVAQELPAAGPGHQGRLGPGQEEGTVQRRAGGQRGGGPGRRRGGVPALHGQPPELAVGGRADQPEGDQAPEH